MNSAEKIAKVANDVRDLLLSKNKAYGDSALKPANIFARGSAVENLCSRIDDKLMRIKNLGITDKTEDTVQDLIGYLILLKIAIEDERNNLQDADGQESELHNAGDSIAAHSIWQTTTVSH
jgi:hypothetical protein